MNKVLGKPKIIYSIFIICWLGLFLSTLDTGIINLALDPLSIELGVSLDYIGLSITLYLLFLIIFLIPSGWFGDFYGQKLALIIGFSIFGLTSLTAGFSASANQLIISRCGQGFGAALLQANCLGLAGQQSVQQKLKLNAVIMLAISLGPILGPSFGGFVLKLWGWQLLFLINVPLCVLGCFFSLQISKNVDLNMKKFFDFKGMMLFFIILAGCVSLIYYDYINFSLFEISIIAILILLILIYFWKFESKVSVPFFPVKLLMFTSIRYIFIGSLVFGLTAGVMFSVSPIMFIRNTDYSIEYIGLVCTMSPIGVILSIFIKRLLSNNTDKKIILYYALPFLLLAFALLFISSFDISIFKYTVAALFYGIGGGLFQSSLIHIAMDQQKEMQSTIAGLLRLFQNGGIIMGASYSLSMLETNVTIVISLHPISVYQQLWAINFCMLIMMFIYSYISLCMIKKTSKF